MEVQVSQQVLSWKPRVVIFRNFLSPEVATPSLKPSKVASGVGHGKRSSTGRTSEGFWLSRHSDSITQAIEERISTVTHMPLENGEALYILRYLPSQFYKAHYDYFLQNKGREKQLARGGQRYISFLMYLNEVEEGGATEFTKIGLQIKPERGLAMMFYNLTPDGTLDRLTKHAGCPVIKGEKWLCTKWFRVGDRKAAKEALKEKEKEKEKEANQSNV